jgi:4-amino-4-deoxy-L-arabinose transferase-like glycosyltransferase
MAARKIALPGLYYDEMVYLNPAFGGSVARRFLGFPVLVMPYVGALKAYLYFPIFAVFGVSAETVRLPAIFISLMTLGLTFRLARLTFRPFYSALLVLLMALDPIFIFMTKADYGPIVLMMFLKILALYFLFRFIFTSSPRYLWGLAFACGLGLYDKLNFLWFVLALSVATIIVFRYELRAAFARNRVQFIWPVGALLFVLVGSAKYVLPLFLHTHPHHGGLVKRVSFIFHLYIDTMNSRDVWFMQAPLSMGTITNWVTIGIMGLIVAVGTSRLFRRKSLTPTLTDRVVLFYLLSFVLIFVQILVTNAADSPNHILMLYPFHYVLLIGVADRLSDSWTGTTSPILRGDGLKSRRLSMWRVAALGALVSVVALLVASQITAGVRYQQAIDKQSFNHMWTPAIYKLAAWLYRRDVDAVVSVEWGIDNQLFALSRPHDRGKYVDLWQEFTRLDTQEQGRALAERFFVGKRVLAIVAMVGHDRGRQHFKSFIKYYFGGGVLQRVISDDRGKAQFGIYYVDARTRDGGREPTARM